jgi:hypothetical protein
VQRAARLDTTAISDALDRLGIAGQCLNIKPLDPRFRLTGRAFTILYGPAGNPAGTVGDYIDDVRPGSVVVHRDGSPQFCIEQQNSFQHRDRDFDPFEELLGSSVVSPLSGARWRSWSSAPCSGCGPERVRARIIIAIAWRMQYSHVTELS